jgi:hypothetical protein
MNAKQFFDEISSKIRKQTDRKILNAARKVGLKDTYENVLWYTGLNTKEFSDIEVAKEL